MRRRSKKRAAQERQYLRLRNEWIEGRRCEGPGCDRWAEECHHSRGREGARLLEVEWWKALCSPCHRFYTLHPEEAYDQGISFHRNQTTPIDR